MVVATIVSVDGVLSAPLQLGAKALLSRRAQVCPADKSKWKLPKMDYDPGLAADVMEYLKKYQKLPGDTSNAETPSVQSG